METFSALLDICAGNSPVPGEFLAQRPVARSFDLFFDLRPNKRLSKQWWGWWFETPSSPLWRHFNVLVMVRTHMRSLQVDVSLVDGYDGFVTCQRFRHPFPITIQVLCQNNFDYVPGHQTRHMPMCFVQNFLTFWMIAKFTFPSILNDDWQIFCKMSLISISADDTVRFSWRMTEKMKATCNSTFVTDSFEILRVAWSHIGSKSIVKHKYIEHIHPCMAFS